MYFYRDNFMLDPKVYTEIEEGLKYFSPRMINLLRGFPFAHVVETAQIIQQVRQEQFHGRPLLFVQLLRSCFIF